jgi:anti-anti-sigma regulatory factor
MNTSRSNNELSYRYPIAMMDIDISHVQARVPVTIFRLKERINLGNTEQLVEKAREAFNNGTRYLLIDLTNVLSVTSAGLRAIQSIYKIFCSESLSGNKEPTGEKTASAIRESACLKIINPNPELRRILSLVGFDKYIEIFNTQQEALLALVNERI